MASSPPRKPAPKSGDTQAPWQAGDPIPAPEALHRDGDSAWALWTEVSRQHEARFAETAPMSVPARLSPEEVGWAATRPADSSVTQARRTRPAQPVFTLETAMLVARRNNRVCPRPERWQEFSALLPARKTVRGTLQPPVAITGAAWNATPALTKRLCFREQIEWAEREGVLENAMAFMQALPEGDWLHMGED